MSDEQAQAMILDWEAQSIDQLLISLNYNLQRIPWASNSLRWYTDLCIRMAGKKQAVLI